MGGDRMGPAGCLGVLGIGPGWGLGVEKKIAMAGSEGSASGVGAGSVGVFQSCSAISAWAESLRCSK